MLNMLALVVSLEQILPVLVTTIIFVLLGLLIFAVAFIIIIYVSPFSVKKEIEEDQNTSLGIIIGSVIIGIAIIIAAAIHG
jgi:putative membrane protein